MKMIRNCLVLIVLVAIAPSLCFADWMIGPVSKERAKALGMEIRSKPNGTTQISVEFEIKTEGEMKQFGQGQRDHVELEIREGEKRLMSAALKEDRSKPGRVIVRFAADQAELDKITLRVWIAQGLGGEIYELRVKDFVALENR